MNKDTESVLFARRAAELISNHDDEQALAILEKGTGLHPGYAAGFLLLGELLSRRGETAKSLKSLERALILDPQNPRLMFTLGQQYLETDPDRARELLWKARRYEPEDKNLAEVFHGALSEVEMTEPGSEPENYFEQTSARPDESLDSWTSQPDDTDAVEPVAEPADIEEGTVPEEPPVSETAGPAEHEPAQESDTGIPSVHDEMSPSPETIDIPETGIAGTGEESLSQSSSDTGIPEGSEAAHIDNAIDELLSGVPGSAEESDDTRSKYIISMPFRDEAGFEDVVHEQEIGPARLDASEETPPLEEMTETEFSLHVFEPAEPEPEPARESEPSETGREPQSAPEEEPLQREGNLAGNEPETEMVIGTDAGDFTAAYVDVLEHAFSGMATEDVEKNTVEIPEEEFIGLKFDENSTEMIADSILTEQERAELAGLDSVSGPEPHEPAAEIPGHADDGGILFESSGELSQEELDSLSSVMKTESESHAEPNLHDGIDYTDVLYGQMVETDGGTPVAGQESLETLDEFENFVRQEYGPETSVEEQPVQGEEPAGISEPRRSEMTGPDNAGTAGQADDSLATGEISPADAEPVQDFPAPAEIVSPISADFNIEFAGGYGADAVDDVEAIQELIRDSMAPEETASMEAASLDMLIDDYVKALDLQGELPEPAASRPEIGQNETSPVREPGPAPGEQIPDTGDIEPSDFPIEHGESTATMAEIFFKQGMISRAIAIYKGLVRKQPQNEKLLARLTELQRLYKTMSGST